MLTVSWWLWTGRSTLLFANTAMTGFFHLSSGMFYRAHGIESFGGRAHIGDCSYWSTVASAEFYRKRCFVGGRKVFLKREGVCQEFQVMEMARRGGWMSQLKADQSLGEGVMNICITPYTFCYCFVNEIRKIFDATYISFVNYSLFFIIWKEA